MCVISAVAAAEVIEEAAYPNSILADPPTRERFLAVQNDEEPHLADGVHPGFWRRQFSVTPTATQKRFDWTFSVILPVICFAFDPFVFRADGFLFLYKFAPIAIPLSFAAVMGTMLWLMMGKRLGRINAWLSALFAISAVASLAIGVVLFPFSLLGIMVIIGFLGFTPLLMSFSLFRNAVRAHRAANAHA